MIVTDHPRRPDRNHRPPLTLKDRELLDAADIGRLCSRSRKTICDWNRDGLIPAPLQVQGSVLWRRREIQDWIIAGCPERSSWTWNATTPIEMERYVRILSRHAAELDKEIAEAKVAMAEGKEVVLIRRK